MNQTELLQSNLSNAEIASIIGKSKITVVRLRKKLGIPAKTGSPKILTEKYCSGCQSKYLPKTSTQKFCSISCSKNNRKKRVFEILIGQKFGRLAVISELVPLPETFTKSQKQNKWWICECDCGTKNVIVTTGRLKGSPSNSGTKSCGCLRKELMSAMAKSKTGRKLNSKDKLLGKNGYVTIYVGSDINKYSDSNNGKYIAEHTYIMSKFLGRPIRKGETIHHKNGIRNDNRIENLELWSGNQPTGQRVDDKTKWAIEWLKIYSPHSLINSQ